MKNNLSTHTNQFAERLIHTSISIFNIAGRVIKPLLILFDVAMMYVFTYQSIDVVGYTTGLTVSRYVVDLLLFSIISSIPLSLYMLGFYGAQAATDKKLFASLLKYWKQIPINQTKDNLLFGGIGLTFVILDRINRFWILSLAFILSYFCRGLVCSRRIGSYQSIVQAHRQQTARDSFNQLMDRAINEYGMPVFVKSIFAGYKTHEIRKEKHLFKESMITFNSQTFELCTGHSNPAIYVTNDDRMSRIEQIIKDAGIKDPLFAIIEHLQNEELLLPIYSKWYGAYNKTRFPEINRFIARRMSEMEDAMTLRVNMYIQDYLGTKAGLEGERALQTGLLMHKSLVSLFGMRYEAEFGNETRSAEMDAICITPAGVFAIEVKNYGWAANFKIEIEADGAWYKRYGEKDREPMPNPYAQNDWHVAVLEDLAFDILGRRVPVYNIIVLANDKVDVSCSPAIRQTLSRVGTAYSQIMQYAERNLSEVEIETLKTELAHRSLPPKKYPLMDCSSEMAGIMRSYEKLGEFAKITYEAIEKSHTSHQ